MTRNHKTIAAAITALFLMPSVAFAQAMPWETPLQRVLQSVQGPTLRIIIILSIVLAGLAFMVGEAGAFWRRIMAVIVGGAVAAGAATFAPTFFGF